MTDPIHLVNGNYRFAYERWSTLTESGDVARFGPISATSSGTDIPAFNRIFALDAAPREEIATAAEWMADRGLPFCLITTGERRAEVEELATSLGLVETEHAEPGMVLTSLESFPGRTSDVSIEIVSDEDTLAEMTEIFATEFEFPVEIARFLTPPAALDEASMRYLVGRIDGQFVSMGTLIAHDDVAGVYSVGTINDFRGRGIGTDITWELLRLGREDGCRRGVLQSTEMGYSVYTNMGFEPVVKYHTFTSAPG